MSEKIVVGPINKGIRTDREPFVIDNDSFPVLINAYQWRGRVKRKRGTTFLGRLQRFLGTTNGAGNLTVTIVPAPITSGISTFTVGTDVFVDPGGASPVTLLTNSSGSATLNRTTGVLTITGSQAATAVIYFPTLPVMGLEDFTSASNQFPLTLGFDTVYAYNIPVMYPYTPYDVSFYKNPATGPAGYVPKGTWTPVTWNGQDYQQFWTVNYQGALWATNGAHVPFDTNNIGMQFKPIVTVTVLTPTTANLQITAHGLVVGDFVFINEVLTTTGINLQTGYVTTVAGVNNVIVTFPNATLATNGSGGIAQYLTSRSDTTLDCIRWYDGDPTNGVSPLPSTSNGWVNFMPPLSNAAYSIGGLPAAIYYLVGAKMIVPFKDRLLFLGPVVQSSSAGPFYLQDTIVYSQNGTPYYTASFTGNPLFATTVFNPILVPVNQTATAPAWFEDVTGFGGFITAGIDQPINTVSSNEDVLLVGFEKVQSRLVYSGNDILPFNFFLINSEYGSGSTFSTITFDKGAYTIGGRGIVVTSQNGTQRVDLEIPDQVFEFSLQTNGPQRITSVRDFINEWIYFTYNSNEQTWKFPNQTLLYNYREQSWGIFNESYTTYGQFRRQSGLTWSTLVLPFTWSQWTDPWNSGSGTIFQPDVIAGNQQGFVLFREDDKTGEDKSLAIQNISGNVVTSPNHTLNEDDYIIISGVLGTGASQVNGLIFKVASPTATTFVLNGSTVNFGPTDYSGGGVITRMYVPQIQTKQFPLSWEMARKTRLGPQQYLLTTTPNGQITLLIFLSQNSAGAYNNSPIVPDVNSVNNSLIYSTVLYTCPESTNLGLLPASTNMLNPANTNLQMVTASQQEQIWHRMNTSLIGDTVQIGFTLSDTQMRDVNFNNQFVEIELHGFVLDVSPSQVLA